MKTPAILIAILAAALAKPNGFYHQEYNYQTSSSSYKNHELQHRNDDQGYYSKDGDLEGRLRPRVNAHSQHSEYVNPKLQHGYRIGTDRTSSFGQLHAQNRFQYGEPGVAPEMGGAFAFMSPQHQYDVQSNLGEVTTRLQAELERELARAVQEQHQRAMAYGGSITQAQIENDRRILEEELRRNMTMRVQEALKAHYGNQGIRGAYSYSIINGRLQPTANYNNQELTDLTRQMEMNLLKHLDQQVRTYYTSVNTQVHTTRNTYRMNGGVNEVAGNYPAPIQQRPYPYPRPVIHPQPYPQPQPHPVPPIPDSITTVATRVQTELNEILNKILEDTQRRYFAETAFNSGVNYDAILVQLQNELRANITFHFDDQIKRAYGYSNYINKYSVEDIENLRRQIETNLITKLNRDFNRQREKYFETHHIYMTPRPILANHVYYSHPVHPVTPVNDINYRHVDIAQMQRQLQEQLSRQLQTALMRQSYRQAHTYTDTNFNPEAHYQAALQQLSQELNRNLTLQMNMLNNAQYQSGVSAAQIANMRNQLQHDLMRQLEQGLQQSFSRYSSWRSSSSWSSSQSGSANNGNYRPVRGFNQNVYNLMPNEDCMMGDDPKARSRNKRSAGYYHRARNNLNQPIQTGDDSVQQTEDLDGLTQQTISSQHLTLPTQHNRHLNDLDLTQQVQTHDNFNQQTYVDDDLTQQIQPVTNEKPETFAVYQDPPVRQTVYVHMDTPPEQAYNKPPFVQVQGQGIDIPPKPPTSEFTQRTRNVYYQKPFVPNYNQESQQFEGSDSTRQVQTHDNYNQQAHVDDDLTQQIQSVASEKMENFERGQGVGVPPNSPTSDFTQQTRNVHYQRPFVPNYNQESQQFDGSDLTQQVQTEYRLPAERVVNLYGQRPSQAPVSGQRHPSEHLTTSDQQSQIFDHSDLTQQVQNPRLTEPVYTSRGVNPTYSSPNQAGFYPNYPSPTPNNQYTYNQNTYRNRYETSRPYISTYDWYIQRQNQQRDLVNQRVQYYENLRRQNPNQQPFGTSRPTQNQQVVPQVNYKPKPNVDQSEDLLGQQTVDSDSIQKLRDLPGQQTEDNLTQQVQTPDFNNPESQWSQIDDLNQGYRNFNQQTNDLEKLRRQQAQIYTNQQSQDLTKQNEEIPQHIQSLVQEVNQELGQQNEEDNITENPETSRQSRTQQIPAENYNQQNQDLIQQTEDLIDDEIQQYQRPQTVSNTIQKNSDQIEQIRPVNEYHIDSTQQTEDLTQQSHDLTQQIQNLNHQQSDDLTQQTEDLTQQSEDLTQQSEDLTQQTSDLTQHPQNNYFIQQTGGSDQQSQYLTQQTEDLIQQSQDLTQQTEDLTQQSQDLTQQTEDLTQQSQDFTQQTQDLTQQSEDLTQQSQDSTQQTQDLLQDEINQFQQSNNKPSRVEPLATPNQNTNLEDQRRLTEAQRESQRLIDLLRRQSGNNQQQNYYGREPMSYSPQPVYGYVDNYPVQVGTTRHIASPNSYKATVRQEDSLTQKIEPIEPIKPQTEKIEIATSKAKISYLDEPEEATTIDIQPIEPEFANKVQNVEKAEQPQEEVTTKKPSWWRRFGNSIQNKLG